MAKPVDDKFLDPTRPIHEPTTFESDERCGKFLYLIAKVQANLPLTVLDRDIILRALREQWLTNDEHKAFMARGELADYETAKEFARRVAPRGQRQQWVQDLYGKSKATLIRYFVRKRHL
jgi:hypothetical protein